MNSIKDWMCHLLTTETIDTNIPRNTKFYIVLESNTQQQSLMSQNHRHITSIHRQVCWGYKNSDKMDQPVQGTRLRIKILFSTLFVVKVHS